MTRLLALLPLLGPLLMPPAVPPGPAPVRVLTRAWSPVVAVEMRFPGGSAADPAGREGLAALLGAAAEEVAGSALPAGAGRIAVEVDRRRTRIVLTAPRKRWPEALEAVTGALLRRPLSDTAVVRARDDLADALAFARGSPVTAFRAELRSLLAGEDHPWTRPVRGTQTSLGRISAREVRTLQRRTLRAERARVAVVGGDDPERIRARVRTALGLAPRAAPAAPDTASAAGPDSAEAQRSVEAADLPAAPDSAGAPDPTRTPAWTRSRRQVRVREVTNRWTAVAFPVEPGASGLHLELAVHALDRTLNRRPPAPELYGVDVEVVDAPGGRVLQVVATLETGSGAGWETRILEAVDRLARTPPQGRLFTELRRSYRNERLRDLAAPEAEARWILDHPDGEGADVLVAELWSVAPGDLARAARSLGPPRVLQYGPEAVPTPTGTPGDPPTPRLRPDPGAPSAPPAPSKRP